VSFSPEKIIKNYPLKELTSFKIGGNAELYYMASTVSELSEAYSYAFSKGIPVFVLGGGTNLVVSDKGLEGLVLHNKTKDVCELDSEKQRIRLSTGFEFGELVEFALDNSFAGAESFAGIPGSIGGAICGNAGAYGQSISDIFLEAEIITPTGERRIEEKAFFEFSYRNSILKREPYVVLTALFQFSSGDLSVLKQRTAEIIETRKSKHPNKDVGCAGSYFKNLPPQEGMNRRRAAGELLDKLGVKSMTYGGASVFQNHANFIINSGQATAADVKKLASLIKDKVYKETGIRLEEEVKYVGKFEE